MKERKLKEDYRLETRIDPRTGREKRVPVYQGIWFSLPPEYPRREALAWAWGSGLGFAVLLLGYLFFGDRGTYVLYVLLPAICALMPLAYWMSGAFTLLRSREKMTRLQRETGPERVLHSAAGCLILSGMAALGESIRLLVTGRWAAELLSLSLLAGAAIAALMAVRFFSRLSRALDRQMPTTHE